jgi:hypothetical protein
MPGPLRRRKSTFCWAEFDYGSDALVACGNGAFADYGAHVGTIFTVADKGVVLVCHSVLLMVGGQRISDSFSARQPELRTLQGSGCWASSNARYPPRDRTQEWESQLLTSGLWSCPDVGLDWLSVSRPMAVRQRR